LKRFQNGLAASDWVELTGSRPSGTFHDLDVLVDFFRITLDLSGRRVFFAALPINLILSRWNAMVFDCIFVLFGPPTRTSKSAEDSRGTATEGIMSAIRMLAVAAFAAGAVLPVRAASAQTLTTLYSFAGGTDGSSPYPGLFNGSGTFFGTTMFGGSAACPVGCGIVYGVMPEGTEYILHSFTGGADGEYPGANLVSLRGSLFGTTANGGDPHCNKPRGCGTVFSVGAEGFEKVLYAFKNGADGRYPEAGLTIIGTTLYGTTTRGCAHDKGAVFRVTLAGDETILYSFKGGSDGADPEATLTDVGGVLYGTTTNGGGGKCPHGCGIVFTVTPAGVETVLHAFTGKDGAYPGEPLIVAGGTLYGTTGFGGGLGCSTDARDSGCGTVFSMNLAGVETVLHKFAGGADGANPYGLVYDRGTLFGTTVNGGGTGCFGFGCGTVFKVRPSGSRARYSLLSSFAGGSAAANPYGLVHVGNELYGTSLSGGAFGDGTVFQFTP
jgi:uncharacterized repeat protein (TIGR03803 family)